jgi:mannose-6-phosphate isomerase-like protein (cupin superfamily)
MLGPHTELFGLVAPGDWVDFFRHVGETFDGLIVPETDNRNLSELLIPKLMQAKDRFDVVFVRDYQPPSAGEWKDDENQLPDSSSPYFLKSMTGPRWMAGGVLSRPFITTAQTKGKFAISSIESSSVYGKEANVLSRPMSFEVDHCLCVCEGVLLVKLRDEKMGKAVREGETVVIPSGTSFSLEFDSRFVRVISFASGDGIEALIQQAGSPWKEVLLPDKVDVSDESKLAGALSALQIKIS